MVPPWGRRARLRLCGERRERSPGRRVAVTASFCSGKSFKITESRVTPGTSREPHPRASSPSSARSLGGESAPEPRLRGRAGDRAAAQTAAAQRRQRGLSTTGVPGPVPQVKKALCVLIQHNLATFRPRRGGVEYEAQCGRILRILRYPRYIYTAKTLYGDTGELIVEELLLNGQLTMSAVVRKVADRLTETMEGGKLCCFA